jgi:hypothetical protein
VNNALNDIRPKNCCGYGATPGSGEVERIITGWKGSAAWGRLLEYITEGSKVSRRWYVYMVYIEFVERISRFGEWLRRHEMLLISFPTPSVTRVPA